MTDEHEMTLELREWLDESFASLPDGSAIAARVRADVHRAPQQHGRWPRFDSGRFQSMFSATKFVAAGAIVALFGGFLLAGVMTQPNEESVPAVGASASPSAVPMPPVDSIQGELLPDVELVTEQVSPTVFRVIDDGPGHDLSHIWQVDVGQNDAVWILTSEPAPSGKHPRIFRLGEPGAYTPADGIPKRLGGIEVGVDDRLYAYASNGKRVTLDDWVVLTEQGWRPATKEDRQAANRRLDKSVGSRVTAADGTTWEIDRYVYHQGSDGRTEYRLEDMGFAWGKKWLNETGVRKIRPHGLAAAPDGRVWSLWGGTPDDAFTPGFALAEFDGATWKDITPRQWRYRSTWPFGDDRSGGIAGASMSVGADGALRLTAHIIQVLGVHGPGDGWAPVERVVASWDGIDWTIESRTSWDLASIPDPSGPLSHIWIAHWASSGTMVLQIGQDGLDTLLYIIEPEIDDSLDEDALMAP